MAGSSSIPKLIGAVVGIALIAGGVYSVAFLDWSSEEPLPEPVARPLKSMVIESSFAAAGRKYPGKVAPNEEVELAFQVSGQLVEFLVKKGQDVTRGTLLGRLDESDFRNTLATRQAELTSAKADYERLKGLFEQGMAAEKETIDARARYDAAVASVNIAKKALNDTRLYAPFTGVVADTYVDNFQNVTALRPVLSLQDVDTVEIVVNVPEERVVRSKRGEEGQRYRFVAGFEYLPGKEFEVAIKEFSTEADPATQTYEATFVMPAPQDSVILPGMTVTVREFKRVRDTSEPSIFAVPIEAIPIDGHGVYYVWKVRDSGSGLATVHRSDVSVGEMVGDDILVVNGLTIGDRIALAGVHLLTEGQEVRPFLVQGDKAP